MGHLAPANGSWTERELLIALEALARRSEGAADAATRAHAADQINALAGLLHALISPTATPLPRAWSAADQTLFLLRDELVQIYAPDGSEATLSLAALQAFVAYSAALPDAHVARVQSAHDDFAAADAPEGSD